MSQTDRINFAITSWSCSRTTYSCVHRGRNNNNPPTTRGINWQSQWVHDLVSCLTQFTFFNYNKNLFEYRGGIEMKQRRNVWVKHNILSIRDSVLGDPNWAIQLQQMQFGCLRPELESTHPIFKLFRICIALNSCCILLCHLLTFRGDASKPKNYHRHIIAINLRRRGSCQKQWRFCFCAICLSVFRSGTRMNPRHSLNGGHPIGNHRAKIWRVRDVNYLNNVK